MNVLPTRYAPWMARDLAFGPGLWMLLAGTIAVLAEVVVTVNDGPLFGVHRVGVLCVLLATAGIVSRDVAGGYRRILFAKPISPSLYYTLRWLLGAVAVVIAATLVDVGLFVRLHLPVIGPNLMARALLLYTLLGGLVFLLSTVTRRDWLVAVLLLLMQKTLHSMSSAGLFQVEATMGIPPLGWYSPLASFLYTILPPFHLVGLQQPVTWGSNLAYAATYGIALFGAGIVVLRWRPLGAGIRD